jgi:hypothetical protein
LTAVLPQDFAEGVAEHPDVGTQRVRHLEAGDLAGPGGTGGHDTSVVRSAVSASGRPSAWTLV